MISIEFFRIASLCLADLFLWYLLSAFQSISEIHNIKATSSKKQFGVCQDLGKSTNYTAFKGKFKDNQSVRLVLLMLIRYINYPLSHYLFLYRYTSSI